MTNFFPAASRGSMTRSSASKALSANKVSACIWGRSTSAPCRSWACPAVRKKASGFPRASTMAWILVLNPPLLRPIAWSSPSFFERRRCADVRVRWCCRTSRMNLDWIAKTFRQVAPRYAGAITVKYRLDEQPVILGGDADMAFTAGQNILDPVPLIVPKGVAAHLSAPNQLTSYESRSYTLGNRLIEDAP